VRGRVLLVHTGEPAWTTQIEAMGPEICDRLRDAGFSIDRLEVQGPRGKLR
jgi:hypothetical protein